MSTKDRLRSWGMAISPDCLLCDIESETAHHLFFDCHFSNEIWTLLMARTGLLFPRSFQSIVTWIGYLTVEKRFKTIIILIFQAAIYHVWKERNSRLHSNVHRTPQAIVKDIHLQLRAKLIGLDRDGKVSSPTRVRRQKKTYLSIWFGRVQG